MGKKIVVIVVIIVGISYGVYENIQIEKKFNLKKEKALKIVNTEIEKRDNLNKKMEKLANEFNADYENNINSNLMILKDKIKKATNEKELLNVIDN